MSEIRVVRARRHDEIVVAEFIAFADVDGPRIRIDRGHVGEEHLDVALIAENPPDRRGNVARVQGARRDLIEERLKQMVILTIQQSDRDWSVAKRLGDGQARESTTDDDDAGHGIGVQGWATRRTALAFSFKEVLRKVRQFSLL